MVVLKCDVTIAGDVIDALSAAGSAAAGVPPIRGVFHAACPPPTGSACGKGDDAGTVGFEARTLLPLEVDSRFLEAKVCRARDTHESKTKVYFRSMVACLSKLGAFFLLACITAFYYTRASRATRSSIETHLALTGLPNALRGPCE